MAKIQEAAQYVVDALNNRVTSYSFGTRSGVKMQHTTFDMDRLLPLLKEKFGVQREDLEAVFRVKEAREEAMDKLVHYDTWARISDYFVDEIERIANGKNPVAFASVYESLESDGLEKYAKYMEPMLKLMYETEDLDDVTARYVQQIFFDNEGWVPSRRDVPMSELTAYEIEFIRRLLEDAQYEEVEKEYKEEFKEKYGIVAV